VQGFKSDQAAAGTICDLGIRLPNDFDVNYLKKGTVLCDPKFSTPFVRKFVAKVVVYDLPQGAITKGEQVMVHSYTSKSAGKILNLLSTVDSSTG
jgi:translation elongation factor EF-1alpha